MKEYFPQIIASAILIVLLPVSRLIISKVILKSGRMIQMHEPRMVQIKQVMFLLINVLFVIILTIIWGVEPDHLLVGMSSVFAVIGVALFAQWSILSNITAGVIMFFTSPFRVGDRIHIIDKDIPLTATIENIQTFYTYLRTDDNEFIVVPNNLFLQKVVAVKEKDEDVC